ncbi:MAG: SufE family protein [Pseudomonadaceae bacterium]|nr:SufE family protein [Pseudomonadaceae bacterium]
MTTLPEALEALTILPDWEQRFAFIIELADELPPLPDTAKTDANKVRGCTSQVWMTTGWDAGGKLQLGLDSDAVLVKGLLALVWLAYHGKSREEAAAVNLPALLEPTGLLTNLSPNRRNGFASVVARLQTLAAS